MTYCIDTSTSPHVVRDHNGSPVNAFIFRTTFPWREVSGPHGTGYEVDGPPTFSIVVGGVEHHDVPQC